MRPTGRQDILRGGRPELPPGCWAARTRWQGSAGKCRRTSCPSECVRGSSWRPTRRGCRFWALVCRRSASRCHRRLWRRRPVAAGSRRPCRRASKPPKRARRGQGGRGLRRPSPSRTAARREVRLSRRPTAEAAPRRPRPKAQVRARRRRSHEYESGLDDRCRLLGARHRRAEPRTSRHRPLVEQQLLRNVRQEKSTRVLTDPRTSVRIAHAFQPCRRARVCRR